MSSALLPSIAWHEFTKAISAQVLAGLFLVYGSGQHVVVRHHLTHTAITRTRRSGFAAGSPSKWLRRKSSASYTSGGAETPTYAPGSPRASRTQLLPGRGASEGAPRSPAVRTRSMSTTTGPGPVAESREVSAARGRRGTGSEMSYARYCVLSGCKACSCVDSNAPSVRGWVLSTRRLI